MSHVVDNKEQYGNRRLLDKIGAIKMFHWPLMDLHFATSIRYIFDDLCIVIYIVAETDGGKTRHLIQLNSYILFDMNFRNSY
jgi:hypothetical protein